jgi:hypothetical protein
MWRFRIIVKWYDIWIGVFVYTKQQVVYIFPVPCLGLRIAYYPKDSVKHLSDKLRRIGEKMTKQEREEATVKGASNSYEIYQTLINRHRHDQG